MEIVNEYVTRRLTYTYDTEDEMKGHEEVMKMKGFKRKSDPYEFLREGSLRNTYEKNDVYYGEDLMNREKESGEE